MSKLITGHALDIAVKNYLISCIDNSGHSDKELKTNIEKINFVKECFYGEYGWHVDQGNSVVSSISEWLQGLPSSINIEFYNHKIIELALKWGSLPEGYSEKQADKILGNYFNLLANKLHQLFTGYHLPSEGEK